jgi:hypothetical protein
LALDPEERADADARLARSRSRPGTGALHGELVVLRRASEIMPFVVGLMLAPIFVGLQATIAGAALGGATVVAFVVHRARRVSRLRIGEDGSLSLPGHAEIDWASLRRIELRYRYPWGVARLDRVHEETLELRFELGDGRRIRLARGPLFRREPTREPVGHHRLEGWLRRRSEASGMRVDRQGKRGWIASRPSAER